MALDTPSLAQPFDGDKLYQERARQALPVLVRQAHAQQPIYYQDLSDELGMQNPRNLNYVLGSVGTSLRQLGTEWGEEIPPIQSLVINQRHDVPGDGIAGYLSHITNFTTLSRRQKREILTSILQRIYLYPKWVRVLDHFNLPRPAINLRPLLSAATDFVGGGESECHRAFKAWVAENPQCFGLPTHIARGITEYPLPSGDTVDVLFTHQGEFIAIEVKSSVSSDADITRGIFQCVKYVRSLPRRARATCRRACHFGDGRSSFCWSHCIEESLGSRSSC
jgi:hypothetical protein